LPLLLIAALILTGATADRWRWQLPDGVAPPVVPSDNPMTDAKVALGRRLFYDADLSANGTMACATCHEQRRAFADGNATRAGVHGDPGRRNVPGLANVGWLARLTWADRALTDLEAQVMVPLTGEHPVEMGMRGKEDELAHRLGADACYVHMLARAFPTTAGRIDTRNVAAAIAAFERTMVSRDSAWDQEQRGKQDATFSIEARTGEVQFRAQGCAACHAGPDFTDAAYHDLGIGRADDRGLAEKTGDPADAGRFRTPSLRYVAVTGPWLHDGSARTLANAIRRHPTPPDDETIMSLTAFLETMTDHAFLSDRRLSEPDRACGVRL
jgi:cytochrome c peroxidase